MTQQTKNQSILQTPAVHCQSIANIGIYLCLYRMFVNDLERCVVVIESIASTGVACNYKVCFCIITRVLCIEILIMMCEMLTI